MIKSASQYSYIMKRVQFVALLVFLILFVVKAFGHVEVHMHRNPEMTELEERIDARNREKEWEKFERGEEADVRKLVEYLDKDMS